MELLYRSTRNHDVAVTASKAILQGLAEDGRIASCTITNSTIEAVELALQGEDNSQGALFFVARNSAAPQNVQWFDSSLVWLFEYGGHEYYTFKEYCE